jgi:hypothetical protein
VAGYGTAQQPDGRFTAFLPYSGNARDFATEGEANAAIDADYMANGIRGRTQADVFMSQDKSNPLPEREERVGTDAEQAAIQAEDIDPIGITPEIANAITAFSRAEYLGRQDEARAAAGGAPEDLSDPVALKTRARDQQASWEEFQAGGKQMTQAQVDQAHKNAVARGATFDPDNGGYSDSPQVMVDGMNKSLKKTLDEQLAKNWLGMSPDGRKQLEEISVIAANYPRDGRRNDQALAQLVALNKSISEMPDVDQSVKTQIDMILQAGLSSQAISGGRYIVPEASGAVGDTTGGAAEFAQDAPIAPGDQGFNFFKSPTPSEARRILETQPTDPAQRKRLEAIVRGEVAPNALGALESFLFDPEPSGAPNVLGPR